jgi:hypothetical protein
LLFYLVVCLESQRILVNFLTAGTTAQRVNTITKMTAGVLNSGIVGLGAGEGLAVGAVVGAGEGVEVGVGASTVTDVAAEFIAVPALSVT